MPVWKLLHRQAASVGSMLAVMIAAIVEHSAGGANTFPKKGPPARAGGPIYWAYVVGMSLRLVPAPSAVPTATADQQHYEDNDQKSCGV